MRTRALAAGIGTAAVLLALAAPAGAAPTNDDFRDAFVIQAPATINQTTGGATLQHQEPQPSCAPTGATVWYEFTPSEDTSLAADTSGDFNTVLAVYTGPRLNQLAEVACNDDAAGVGGPSALSFAAAAGQTYHVQAGGFLGRTGNLTLTLRVLGQRTESESYTAGTEVLLCEVNLGGACFDLQGDEVAADIAIEDDVAPWPVGGFYRLFDKIGFRMNEGFFCGSLSGIEVRGAGELQVFVLGPLTGPRECPGEPGFGVQGMIAVTFTTAS